MFNKLFDKVDNACKNQKWYQELKIQAEAIAATYVAKVQEKRDKAKAMTEEAKANNAAVNEAKPDEEIKNEIKIEKDITVDETTAAADKVEDIAETSTKIVEEAANTDNNQEEKTTSNEEEKTSTTTENNDKC